MSDTPIPSPSGAPLVIVSGMSGSGKSVALKIFEDLGYYCVDNLPAELLPEFVRRLQAGQMPPERIAVGIDARSLGDLSDVPEALSQIGAQGMDTRLLFFDTRDEVLLRRYADTRRRHPLSHLGLVLADAISLERQALKPLRQIADHVLDTSELNVHQMRRHILTEYGLSGAGLSLLFESFAYRRGLPPEADLVLDVRCLPNPFYVPELKHKTGLDQEVVDFVMNHPEAKQLLDRYEQFLQVALPLYVKEGKSQLTIAVGCTGGKHRSITFARKIAEYCTSLGYEPGVQHRDAMR